MAVLINLPYALIIGTIKRLVTVGYLSAITGASLVLFVLCILTWVLTVAYDRRLVILHQLTSVWGCLFIWLMPTWSVRVSGRHHTIAGPCVIVANHQSLLDIPVAHHLFVPFKWVSKHALFRCPLIGWTMSLNRYIKLNRGDLPSVVRMLRQCKDSLASGSPVFLFPEGTRSTDGCVGAFRSGAFKLAKSAGVPVLPIAISGTAQALPRGRFKLGEASRMTIEVLPAIMPAEYADWDIDDLATVARNRIVAALNHSPSDEG